MRRASRNRRSRSRGAARIPQDLWLPSRFWRLGVAGLAQRRRGSFVVGVLSAAVAVAVGCGRSESSLDRPIVLWVWQRAEDLAFLEGGDAQGKEALTVAPWIGTVRWSVGGGGGARGDDVTVPLVSVEARSAALRVDPRRVARVVVRLENASGRPGLSPQPEVVAKLVAQLWRQAVMSWPAAGLQVDFDAMLSERDFYRQTLTVVRRELPLVRLETTALLSWCRGDADSQNWLESLPVDRVVPMAFRLGRDDLELRRVARSGAPLQFERCRVALGVALDERPSDFRLWAARAEELFLFPEEPWSAAQLRRGLAVVDQAARVPAGAGFGRAPSDTLGRLNSLP